MRCIADYAHVPGDLNTEERSRAGMEDDGDDAVTVPARLLQTLAVLGRSQPEPALEEASGAVRSAQQVLELHSL